MTSNLPIGIGELLSGAVESSRLEFKASWDPKITGHQLLKTLCAFANDLQNLNGGYVILGVVAPDGPAERPVRGVDPGQIEAIQKQIRQLSQERFDLGRVRSWLGHPKDEVVAALERALALDPNERRFRDEIDRARGRPEG